MQTITVKIISGKHHVFQILTGFSMLQKAEWDVSFEDHTNDANNPDKELGFIEAEVCGKRILYDVMDGYQWQDAMARRLQDCDVYFKRSFSAEKNRALFPAYAEKMYPLGLNYRVTWEKNPLEKDLRKRSVRQMMKRLAGLKEPWQFTTDVFEVPPRANRNEHPRVIFYARLWNPADAASKESAMQREAITQSRIEILKRLREAYPAQFTGGVYDTPYAKQVAPELIVPAMRTARSNYLKEMQASDVCIGTTGLHDSIGGKTGEYVAASKAIVHETLRYELPGDFSDGRNYLSFETADACVDAVRRLIEDPDLLYRMQQANHEYYLQYVRPDAMIRRTLDVVSRL